MDNSKLSECSVCKKCFSNSSNLKKHAKKFHPDAALPESYYKNSKHFKFTCECGKNFNYIRHLKSHQKIHSNAKHNKVMLKNCPLCDFSRYKKNDMLEHFEEAHGISMMVRENLFPNIEEFEKWKTELESESFAQYIHSKSNESNINYYSCHRSGNYTPKDDRVRQLKHIGSKKINAYCPAGIKLIKNNNDGSCKAILTETHLGHDLNLEHIQLTSLERQNLAIKIASGMDFDDIIQEIKQSAYSDSSKRLYHITKKDLRNIELCFNRSAATMKSNGKDKIDTIKEREQSSNGFEDTELDLIQLENLNPEKENIQAVKKLILKEFSEYLFNVTSMEKLENLQHVLKLHYNSF